MKIYDFNGKKNISGQRIKEARLKNKLSQSALTAKMQLHGITIERDCISRMENGTRFVPDYELPVYAEILNVSVEWLLGIEDWEPLNKKFNFRLGFAWKW